MAGYDVFISYSRVDTAFVRELQAALDARQRAAWVDWQGIDYSTKWWDEICAGIEGADHFVLVISPDSLNSVYCQREIAHARRQGKRIIPLLYRAIDEAGLVGGWYTSDEMKPIETLARENLEAIKAIQWIQHEKLGRSVTATAHALIDTVDSDPACVHAHTQLLLQARAWQESGRSPGALLSSDVLSEAERRLITCAESVRFTDEQRAFVQASRALEEERARRAEADQRRARRLRRTAIAAGIVGVLALLAMGGAVSQTITAQNSAATAQAEGTRIGLDILRGQARLVANEAQAALNAGERQQALRLALESLRAYPTAFVTESSLVLSDTLSTPGRRLMEAEYGAPLFGAAWNPDRSRILAWGGDSSAVIFDAATGDRLLTLTHAPDLSFVTTAAWSPDGTRVLTADDGSDVKVWDAQTGALLYSLVHDNVVQGAAWKRDGSAIVTWGIATAWLWDTASGALQTSFLLGSPVAAGAAWDPSETRLVIWGQDGSLRIFDVDNGGPFVSMQHAPVTSEDGMTQIFPVLGALWSADGTRVLSWASGDRQAHVWDAATGELLLSLEHESEVNGAAWKPEDSSQILTWSVDGMADTWDAATGERLLTLHHDAPVLGARWAYGGAQITTWSSDSVVKQWNSRDGTLYGVIRHTNPSREDEFSRPAMGATLNEDAGILLTWGDDQVLLWDTSNDGLLVDLPFRTQAADPYNQIDIGGATMDEDGRRVLAWTQDGRIRVWDTSAGANALIIPARGGAIWNGDESRVLAWSSQPDGGAEVVDAASGQPLLAITLPRGVMRAAWNSDETRLLTQDIDGTVFAWDAASGSATAVQIEDDALFRLRHDDLQSNAVTGMAYSPDGRRIATWTFMGVLRVWDAADGRLIAQMGEDAPMPDSMVLSPRGAVWQADSRRILHWTDDSILHIWDAETGESLVDFPHNDRLIGAVWNSDGTRVLSWGLDGTIRVWSAADGSAVFPPVLVGIENAVGIAPRDFAQSAVWSADETRILVATGAGRVEIYDAQTGALQVRFARRNGRVFGAVWSPDQTRVLSWSEDGSVEIGDVATGATLLRVTHTSAAQGAAWSADGTRILTWAWDNTAQVWDATTGVALLRLRHPNWVMSAAWNADETRLLTWTSFEAVRIWDVTLTGMMAAAQAEMSLEGQS